MAGVLKGEGDCCAAVYLWMSSTCIVLWSLVLRKSYDFVRKRKRSSSAVYTRLAKCSGNSKDICISSWNRDLSRAQTCTASIGHSESLTQEPGFQFENFPLHFSPCFHSTRKDEGKTLSPIISTSSSQVSGWVLEMSLNCASSSPETLVAPSTKEHCTASIPVVVSQWINKHVFVCLCA